MQLPKEQVVQLVVGFALDVNRYQVVIPFVCEDVLTVDEAWIDIADRFENTLRDPWLDCLADDIECLGFGVEPGQPGGCVPFRKNYAINTHPGTIVGQSYPQTTSMLVHHRSVDQAGSGSRVITATSFVGPPAESSASANELIAPFIGTLWQAFWPLLGQSFVGASSASTYHRALSKGSAAGPNVYTVDNTVGDTFLGTQRRRGRPKL